MPGAFGIHQGTAIGSSCVGGTRSAGRSAVATHALTSLHAREEELHEWKPPCRAQTTPVLQQARQVVMPVLPRPLQTEQVWRRAKHLRQVALIGWLARAGGYGPAAGRRCG